MAAPKRKSNTSRPGLRVREEARTYGVAKGNCSIIYDIGRGRLWCSVTGLINATDTEERKMLFQFKGILASQGTSARPPEGSRQFGALMTLVTEEEPGGGGRVGRSLLETGGVQKQNLPLSPLGLNWIPVRAEEALML